MMGTLGTVDLTVFRMGTLEKLAGTRTGTKH